MNDDHHANNNNDNGTGSFNVIHCANDADAEGKNLRSSGGGGGGGKWDNN